MKSLFDKMRIGSLSFKNRFVRAAVSDRTYDGYIDDDVVRHYGELGRSGVGTIISGMTLVDGEEKILPVVALCSDSFIQGHRRLTAAAHRYEATVLAQLAYIGSYTTSGNNGGLVALAPSPVANLLTETPAREIRLGEIKVIQKKFADAALRAKQANYDGVELHFAHGLLMSQFLTPYYNRREDEYGGSIENRTRMLAETVSAVRHAVDYDFPIWVKINSTDGITGGITDDDFMFAARKLAAAGVDAIEVSGNWTRLALKSGAYFRDAAAALAEKISTPVVLTGGNRKYSDMMEILNGTNIEFFGIARPFIRSTKLMGRFRRDFEELRQLQQAQMLEQIQEAAESVSAGSIDGMVR
jgi:2,4-dienoyl-CoA reductase-like NADH-dependent reductase (Old Yellow Enzyme family)